VSAEQGPLNLTEEEMRQRFEAAFRQADLRLRGREHALWCASMVYNGWFGDRTAKYPEPARITDLADHFVDWLAGESTGDAPGGLS
jgi:hypothetical protein